MKKDDTISRQDAINTIMGQPPEAHYPSWYAEQIKKLPSVQPERKKGKWVNCYTDWFKTMCKCSECGAMIDIDEKYRNFFCYHCGSDMREDVLPSAQPTQCNSSNVLRHPQCANRTKLGNCDPVGGFCTSVPKEICDAQEHDTLNGSDLISRAAAINTVHRMREIWDTGDIDDLEEMIVTALAELCPEKRTYAFPCDCISRKAAIECLEHLSACDEPFVEIGIADETFIGKYEAITEISDLPSAQPEPQRIGRWIPCTKNGLPLSEMAYREGHKWYGYKCSNCNFIYKGNALTESPYCKKCGARMGETNESD